MSKVVNSRNLAALRTGADMRLSHHRTEGVRTKTSAPLVWHLPSVVAAGRAGAAIERGDEDLALRGGENHAVAHIERELIESRERGVRRVPHLRGRQRE